MEHRCWSYTASSGLSATGQQKLNQKCCIKNNDKSEQMKGTEEHFSDDFDHRNQKKNIHIHKKIFEYMQKNIHKKTSLAIP